MKTTGPGIPTEEAIRRALGEFQLSAGDKQVHQIQQ
jgi:hypothetical protein